ncbi:MAG: hypothetical protein ACOYBT_10045 [Polynucleobacter sp.]
MADQSLLADIDAFLERTSMAESALGRAAVNDWKFVRSVREGRRLWPETEAKVRDFMREYRSEPAQAAA